MGTRRKLLTVSRWLAKVPSLAYGLTYLAFIPVFALIYYNLPGQFYHSTIQFEREPRQNLEEIQARIGREIFQQYFDINPPKGNSRTWARANDWFVTPERVSNLKVLEREVTFEVFIFANYFPPGVKPASVMLAGSPAVPLKVTIDLFEIGTILTDSKGNKVEGKHLLVEFETQNPSLKDEETQFAIRRAVFPQMISSQFSLAWFMPSDFVNDLRSLSLGAVGVGSAVQGNFVRMLYLSAATITTLGYGDIVAITTLSRILVSIEAILGIVLIGLFLNALSFEREQDRDKVTPSGSALVT